MPDHETTFQQIKDRVHQFVTERDWGKYHDPKNISMALAVEVAELMEHYQWLTTDESRDYPSEENKRKAVEGEVADIATYLFELCNVMNIDLSEAMANKEILNARKYPLPKKGNS